jgi:hypothetical protein
LFLRRQNSASHALETFSPGIVACNAFSLSLRYLALVWKTPIAL